MSANFADLLNTDVTSVQRVTQPIGTYTAQMKSFKEVTSSKKKTKGIEVVFGIVSAGTDVDAEALREFAKVKEIKGLKLTHSFWVKDQDALNYVKDFLAACGISLEGRTFKQALSEAVGSMVNVYVGHEPAQRDPSVNLARIQGFSKVA